MADIIVNNHGSIIILIGLSDAGTAWLEESLDPDAMRWGGGYAVEPRHAQTIIDGATDDGLEVE